MSEVEIKPVLVVNDRRTEVVSMTVDKAAGFLEAYFKKRCPFGLFRLDVEKFVPYEGDYLIHVEMQCRKAFSRRYRLIMDASGGMSGIERLE